MSRRAVFLAISLLLALGLGIQIQSSSASELSDLETQYDQLRQSFDSDTQLVNVTLRGYELEAFRCVQKYAAGTTPEEQALKNDCQVALDRTQADIFNVTRRAVSTQAQMSALKTQIDNLKNSPVVTPSPTASATPTVSPSPITSNALISDSSPQPADVGPKNSTTTTQTQEASKSPSPSSLPSLTPTPKPTPVPSVAATLIPKPTTTATPKSLPKPSASPSVSTTPKTSLEKKVTISCIKDKTVLKITSITPKCPSGYVKK